MMEDRGQMQARARESYLVTVRVDLRKLTEFARLLQRGGLDRTAIRATYCLRDDPAVGLGIWEVADGHELERKLGPWREFYESTTVQRIVAPAEAMVLLSSRRDGSERR